jgi:hypothetical protein
MSMTPKEALLALRDGIDTPATHCVPLPIASSWRYVVDLGIEGCEVDPLDAAIERLENMLTLRTANMAHTSSNPAELYALRDEMRRVREALGLDDDATIDEILEIIEDKTEDEIKQEAEEDKERERLKDPYYAATFLQAALEDNPDGTHTNFLHALRTLAEVYGIEEIDL